MCLAYIRHLDFVGQAIIGIVDEAQLREISGAVHVEIPKADFSLVESRDIELIDPRKWKLHK